MNKNQLLDSFVSYYCPFLSCKGKLIKILSEGEAYYQTIFDCENCGQLWSVRSINALSKCKWSSDINYDSENLKILIEYFKNTNRIL